MRACASGHLPRPPHQLRAARATRGENVSSPALNSASCLSPGVRPPCCPALYRRRVGWCVMNGMSTHGGASSCLGGHVIVLPRCLTVASCAGATPSRNRATPESVGAFIVAMAVPSGAIMVCRRSNPKRGYRCAAVSHGSIFALWFLAPSGVWWCHPSRRDDGAIRCRAIMAMVLT